MRIGDCDPGNAPIAALVYGKLEPLDERMGRTASEQGAAPEGIKEVRNPEDLDSVRSSSADRLHADNNAPLDVGMLLRDLAQTLQVRRANGGGRLGLDGAFKVVDHEIHFDSSAQAPETELGVTFPIGVVAAQLVEDPVLEGLTDPAGVCSCRPAGPHRKNVSEPAAGRSISLVIFATMNCILHEKRKMSMREMVWRRCFRYPLLLGWTQSAVAKGLSRGGGLNLQLGV